MDNRACRSEVVSGLSVDALGLLITSCDELHQRCNGLCLLVAYDNIRLPYDERASFQERAHES